MVERVSHSRNSIACFCQASGDIRAHWPTRVEPASEEPDSPLPTQPEPVPGAVRTGQTGGSVEAPVEESARRGAEAGLRFLPPPLLSEPQDATGDHVRPLERPIPRRLCPSAWVEVNRETVSRPPADEMRKPLSNPGDLAVERLTGSLEVRGCQRVSSEDECDSGGHDDGCTESPHGSRSILTKAI
jgi:hypothetical protein